MDWLIVGLGNPGPRYEGTRHNVGRDALRALARRHGVALGAAKFDTLHGKVPLNGFSVCLAVTLRYMNESGAAVGPLARYFKVPTARVVAIFDDLDLPPGAIRVRSSGGSGGNRGAASLIQALGGEDFPRIRIGIGRPPEGWDAADYVLARFTDDERAIIEPSLMAAADAAESIVLEGIDIAMNRFN